MSAPLPLSRLKLTSGRSVLFRHKLWTNADARIETGQIIHVKFWWGVCALRSVLLTNDFDGVRLQSSWSLIAPM
jgi:hypothetical protein